MRAAPLASAFRVLYWVLLVLTIALLASGIYLVFFYRPVAAVAFDDISGLPDVGFANAMRSVHAITPWIWFVVASVVAGLELTQRSYRRGAAVCVSIGVAVIAVITGQFLPWDQVALWAVTVGSNIAGYAVLFTDDNVRFVLIDGREVSTRTIQGWLFVHIYLGGTTLAIVAACAFRRLLGRQPAEQSA